MKIFTTIKRLETFDPCEDGMEESKTPQQLNDEYNKEVARKEQTRSIMQQIAQTATIYTVGYIDKEVIIDYTLTENGVTMDHSVNGPGVPCQSFLDTLHSLGPHVSMLINKDPGEQLWQGMKLTVKKVMFKYHKNGNLHASVSVTRSLDSGHCFTFSIPFIPLDSADPQVFTYSKEAADIFRNLIDEAKDYIGGKRSQGTLPFPDPADADEGEEYYDEEHGEEREEADFIGDDEE